MNTRIFCPIFFSVALLFTVCGNHSFAAAGKVVCFGDSITAGWPIFRNSGNGCTPPCGGYQPPLQSILSAAGHNLLIENYGQDGETSVDGARRIEMVLQISKPKYLLLLEGTNDAVFFSPSTIRTNLSYMVDRAMAHGVIPILGTLTPDIRARVYKPIPTINDQLRQLAQSRHILLADHYGAVVGRWPALTTDGLHPNAAGYTTMAQVWADKLIAARPLDFPWRLLLLD